MTTPKRVFISYARERTSEAHAWQAALGVEDAFVCDRDMAAFEPGFAGARASDQRTSLERQLRSAEAVLILWDHNYARAAWCAWELATAARHGGIQLLVHALDATPIPAALQDKVASAADADAVRTALAQRRPAPPYQGPLVLDPAASLLEARLAPRFDAATQGVAEIGKRMGLLAATLALQYATYRLGMLWLAGGSSEHLWAIIVAVCIAMTIANAFMLSATAAMTSGVAGVWLGLVAMTAGVHWRGAPKRETVTMVAAGIGTLQVSLALLVRGWLLGYRFSRRSSATVRAAESSRGHGAALLGIAVVMALLLYGLSALDVIIEAKRKGLQSLPDLMALPVVFGRRVGFLAGIALGIAVYRRIIRNLRDTAPWRHARAVAGAVAACGVGVALGWATGWWIQHNLLVEPISKWGGSYAGAQIGVMLAVGMAVPIAAGTGRIGVRQEHVWGLLGAATIIAIIALKVQSFPFAATRKDVPREILLGALAGLAPAGILVAVTHRGGRIIGAAIGVHVALAMFISLCTGTSARDVTPTPVELTYVSQVAAPTLPAGVPVGATPTPVALLPSAADVKVAAAVLSEPRAVAAVGPNPELALQPRDAGADAEPPQVAAAPETSEPSDGPGGADQPDGPAPIVVGVTPGPAAPTPEEGAADGPAGAGGPAAGQGDGIGAGAVGDATGDSSSAPAGAVAALQQVRCPGEGTMSVGDVIECDLGAVRTITSVSLSVGCDDGDHGAFVMTISDGDQVTDFSFEADCGTEQKVPPLRGSYVKLKMSDGGGSDRSVSFACRGAAGWCLTWEQALIQVEQATYGGNVGAGAGNWTSNLQAACNGQRRCETVIDNRFGDPVVGKAKDFTASWTCGPNRSSVSAAARVNEGYSVILECS